MECVADHVVDAILTAILQWRVAWLNEQKLLDKPPPICRAQLRKLKITYDHYKDYESTFVPLLMHEIWAQIFEEWTRFDAELNGTTLMDIDEGSRGHGPNSIFATNQAPPRNQLSPAQKQVQLGLLEYKSEGQYQYLLRCQCIIESQKVSNHMKLVGDGDLCRLDLVTSLEAEQVRETNTDCFVDVEKQISTLSLFAYVNDITSERITRYTTLANCFGTDSAQFRNHHVVNYSIVIAKRPLRLRLDQPIRILGLYYLKPMIRQLEAVAILRESALASDILSPKTITCQLAIPTVVPIKSPYYNDSQYKAIIGANEALLRSIPKIQMIQGPPGTGKTHTLIGIIKHFYMNLRVVTVQMPKFLICAPSNGAIDEVARRLHRVRDFSKEGVLKRSLRLVRVGTPDQISDSVKNISLEELVEANARAKIETVKKRNMAEIQSMEKELSRYETEITNLRYSNRTREIPGIEMQVARLLKELEAKKASDEVHARREISEAAKRNIRYELIRNADVILTTLSSCQRQPMDTLFRGDRAELSFHCVIVDEASQCIEPELLMPLCYKISKMILIGDPMQLPATVISRYAQEFDFGRSLFERFFIHFGHYSTDSPIAMLTEQYRMHPDICRFPSRQFYDNRLISSGKVSSNYPLKPYIMFDLRHGTESKSSRTSLENEVEAGFVKNLLVAVLTKAPEKSQVGVITPYKGQKRLITSKIASLQSQRQIKVDVNTCDGFQGQEKDIIILSCVRTFDSRNSIGFLKSYQRVNVALTRAKHCLIVCISAKSLTSDETWKALVQDAEARGCTQTLTRTPSTVAIEEMIRRDTRSSAAKSGHHLHGICHDVSNDVYLPEPMEIDID